MSLLTKNEAAAELKIGLRTLEKLLAAGEIVPVRIGRRVLIQREELLGFIRRSRSGGAAADVEKISPKQRARFHAQSDRLDEITKERPGTAKAALKAWASDRFGREIGSVNDLTYDEASDLLDELRARADAAAVAVLEDRPPSAS